MTFKRMITVRAANGTFVARVKRQNITASCTMGYEQAARAVAIKYANQNGITLLKLKQSIGNIWFATFEFDARKQPVGAS